MNMYGECKGRGKERNVYESRWGRGKGRRKLLCLNECSPNHAEEDGHPGENPMLFNNLNIIIILIMKYFAIPLTLDHNPGTSILIIFHH